METTIGTWGDSEAIRLPQALLKLLDLHKGGKVSWDVNERANIEIAPVPAQHRRVTAKHGVMFDSLFRDYDPNSTLETAPAAWPNDDLVGAEWDAWASMVRQKRSAARNGPWG